MDPHDSNQHVPGASSQASAGPEKLPGFRHVIAVGSGKGGVGKSTVSVNFAFALQQMGNWIGLVDADILGPSIPGMMGLPVGQPPTTTPDGKIVPADRHNLKVMSMGMLTGNAQPGHLARTDGGQVPENVHRHRAMGTPGLLDSRPPARDRRHPADAGAELPFVGCDHRDDAAGREPEDRPSRFADVRDRACPHTRHH